MRNTPRAALVAVALAAIPASGEASVVTTHSATKFARAIAAHPSQIVGARWVKFPPKGHPAVISTTPKVNFPRFRHSYGVLSSGDARGIARSNNSDSRSSDNGGAVYRGTRDT